MAEETEWLGDRDGRAGMGERIWPTAFEIDARRQRLNGQVYD